MNYLELVQAAAKQAGHGSLNIQTTANQTRMSGMFAMWVADAWDSLQAMRSWNFMRKSASFSVTTGKREYTRAEAGISDLREWCKSNDQRAYLTVTLANGETATVRELDRQLFFDRFKRTPVDTRAPAYFCMTESGTLELDAVPDQDGTAVGQYWKYAVRLEDDADEPDMNPEWHRAIIGLALKEYGEYDEAPAVLAKGRRIFNGVYERMCIDALPEFVLAPNPMSWNRR